MFRKTSHSVDTMSSLIFCILFAAKPKSPSSVIIEIFKKE